MTKKDGNMAEASMMRQLSPVMLAETGSATL